jgi:hypothetical protein
MVFEVKSPSSSSLSITQGFNKDLKEACKPRRV